MYVIFPLSINVSGKIYILIVLSYGSFVCCMENAEQLHEFEGLLFL